MVNYLLRSFLIKLLIYNLVPFLPASFFLKQECDNGGSVLGYVLENHTLGDGGEERMKTSDVPDHWGDTIPAPG